jgi:molybdate transport system regulatory protein
MVGHAAAARRPQRTALSPRVKVWLEMEGNYVFGFGVSEMLRAVEKAGSIKHAAAEMGMSYRYVWGRIKKAEQILGRRLVETQVGGQGARRSFLTPEGQKLSAAFLAFRNRMAELTRKEFARYFPDP